jgi:hypothetical protein
MKRGIKDILKKEQGLHKSIKKFEKNFQLEKIKLFSKFLPKKKLLSRKF